MKLEVMNKHTMFLKRYFMYLIFYSFGGFILERIINLIFYQVYYDNSVLFGPYQPLYGSGVLLTILFADYIIVKFSKEKRLLKDVLLLIMAILFTALVEAITGYGFEYLFNMKLWDYGEFFPCSSNYVCIYPSTLFGIASYLVVKYLHPIIKQHLERVNTSLYYLLLIIFVIDIIITFITL
jgi:uncharacterized membrane protein